MHIATIFALEDKLIPQIIRLINEIDAKASQWMDVVKIGRTHLEDAVPLSVGQEWSGWSGAIKSMFK